KVSGGIRRPKFDVDLRIYSDEVADPIRQPRRESGNAPQAQPALLLTGHQRAGRTRDVADRFIDMGVIGEPERREAIGAGAVALEQLDPGPRLQRVHTPAHYRVIDHQFLRGATDSTQPAHRL